MKLRGFFQPSTRVRVVDGLFGAFEPEQWIAHCVDHWMVTQGDTQESALERLKHVMAGQDYIAEKHKYSLSKVTQIAPAPDDVMELYEESEHQFTIDYPIKDRSFFMEESDDG